MQKAESGTITAPPKPQLEKKKLIEIMVSEDGQFHIGWPINQQERCLVALAEAVKLVATTKPQPDMIQPAKPSVMDFIKGVKK